MSMFTSILENNNFTKKESRKVLRRFFILILLVLLSICSYLLWSYTAPNPDFKTYNYLPIWVICFVIYFFSCFFILKTEPLSKKWMKLELGLLFLGVIFFWCILLPLPSGLSRDVWRYLWDARVTIHGYSPYLYSPGDPILSTLAKGNILFQNCRFRNIPTDYPPGAEFFFILGYIFSDKDLLGIKGVLFISNLVTCIAIILLLKQKKLDPRIFIVYAWCPIVLVEFAVNGHSDVLAIMFVTLALLANNSNKKRIFVGICLGMAILTRIYPLILIPAFLKKKDFIMLSSLLVTIFLGYLPFLILGHGFVFGFFLTFASEQGGNGGILLRVITWIATLFHASNHTIIEIELIIDLLLFLSTGLFVLLYRKKHLINTEQSVLLLLCSVFIVASHIFSWYLPVFLPIICLLFSSKTKEQGVILFLFLSVILWYFVCASMADYFPLENLSLSNYNQVTQLTLRYGFVTIKFGFLILIGIIGISMYRQHREIGER